MKAIAMKVKKNKNPERNQLPLSYRSEYLFGITSLCIDGSVVIRSTGISQRIVSGPSRVGIRT